MRTRRPWYLKSLWFVAPGALVALFAVASIALPVGSDGLGRGARSDLGRWACEIHDGFWHSGTRLLSFAASGSERTRAQRLCYLGEAEQAMAIYRRIGARTDEDQAAMWALLDRLVLCAEFDRAEKFVPDGDHLLGTSSLRNNLAWHYTQANIRTQKALDLALASVADSRNACNVDTLAWAYYRDGQTDVAASVAHETLAMGGTTWEAGKARESSTRLLALLGKGRTKLSTAPATSGVQIDLSASRDLFTRH